MKILITLIGLVFLAGCNAGHVGGFNRGFNNAYMMDMQMRQPSAPVQYYPQNNNNTYWQEQNARRQYFESIRPQSLFNPDGTAR